LLGRAAARIAAWPTHTKLLLGFATTVLIVELVLRRFARGTRAYALWTRGFEALGAVWTALILSLIYVLSVGPVSLAMRLARKDPLERAIEPGRSAWHAHEPNPLGPRAAARHQF
jgi:hypothetical protein